MNPFLDPSLNGATLLVAVVAAAYLITAYVRGWI